MKMVEPLAGLCLPLSSRVLVKGLACGVCLGDVPLYVLLSSTPITHSEVSFLFPPAQCVHWGNRKASVNQTKVTGETLTDIHESKIQLHLLDKLCDPEGKTFWFEFFDNPILIAAPC